MTVAIVDGSPVEWSILDLDAPEGAATTAASLAVEGMLTREDLATYGRLVADPVECAPPEESTHAAG